MQLLKSPEILRRIIILLEVETMGNEPSIPTFGKHLSIHLAFLILSAIMAILKMWLTISYVF